MKATRLTRCALFTSMALIIYVVESLLPPFTTIPGFKLGLANTVTLAVVYLMGYREAFLILILRIILGNMFTGQMMSLIYSLSGGLLSFVITVILKRFFPLNTIWALGIIGALFHTLGQTVCATILFNSNSFLYYSVFLSVLSFVSGAFTGFCAQLLVKYLKTHF